MPFPINKLRVLPNPWTFIDHFGRPAGRLPFDGYEHSPGAGYVGAKIVDVTLVQKTTVMRVAGKDLEIDYPQHDHRISYSKEAVSIPNTAYYRDALRRLDLVAADAKTAEQASIKFEDPVKVLAKCRAEAVVRFDAETDQDAYTNFGAVEPLYDSPPQTAPPVATVATAAVEQAKDNK